MTDASTLSHMNIKDMSRRWLKRGEGGRLHAENIPLHHIADVVGTPFYCYSAGALRDNYARLKAAVAASGVSICFAVKACSNINILAELARQGCGMDIVSGGEMARALAAGTPPERIIFSGVGKTRAEIHGALEAGVYQLNVESQAELDIVAAVARETQIRAPIALRVNPDVDALTHAKITTAKKDSKFGIAIGEIPALYAAASARPELRMVGLAVHIGSQILDLTPFRDAWSALAGLVRRLRDDGFSVERLDLGGGLGIGDDIQAGPDLAEYAAIIAATVGDLGCKLNIEPGRWLSGRTGVLASEVLYVKQSAGTPIAVIDAAMNDLMRPALYSARHPVLTDGPARAVEPGSDDVCRIVGPVCESSDDFGKYEGLGTVLAGDLLVFDNVGAYGAAMSSTYNSRDLVAEVLVDGERFRVVRRRATIADALQLEQPEAWHSKKNPVG